MMYVVQNKKFMVLNGGLQVFLAEDFSYITSDIF